MDQLWERALERRRSPIGTDRSITREESRALGTCEKMAYTQQRREKPLDDE